MYTNLDRLIIAFMIMAVAGATAMLLMFLSKNCKVRSFCLYAVAVLGIYAMSISLRIFWPYYTGQLLIAVVLGAMSVGAMVLKRKGGEGSGIHTAARVMAALSCAGGLVNAFM